MKQKIGIIGLGYVGKAVYYWFENFCSDHIKLFVYDKYKNNGSVPQVNQADILFICVPTPYYEDGRGYSDSEIKESLANIEGSKTIIIKSTILPGSTKNFQEQFPQHKILFNPEFLTAKNATEDFLHPDRQIVGYTKKSQPVAEKILRLLPKAPFSRTIRATEAEMVKYFGNIFLATKVVFANQMYDLCQKLDVNYDTVKESAGADPRINSSHLNIFQDGHRGYSGACLPKDTKALIDLAQQMKVGFELIEKVDKINSKLIKK